MSYRIQHVREARPDEWDCHWEACDHATYYQSRDWSELWSGYSGGRLRPAARHLTFDDGADAVLPLTRERALLGARYLAGPAGTHGGWVARAPLEDGHARALDAYLAHRPRDLAWRVSPFTPALDSARSSGTPSSTLALRLDPDVDRVMARWQPAARRALRRAQREGVEVAPAKSERDWRAYYDAYLDSQRRWGDAASNRYEWRLFEALAARPAGNVTLWLAHRDGELLSGALCLYAKRHVGYWHGATYEHAFPLRPVQAIFHEAIRDACMRGFHWFDFNPSGGNRGVERLKRSFGAEELHSPLVRRTSTIRRIARRLGCGTS